jgi:anti-sigma B factor antagonist
MDAGPGAFRIETSRAPGECCVVALHGELDMAQAPVLTHAFAELSDSGDEVVVDLSELSFIDSTGIQALINAAAVIRDHGGVMTLRAPKADIQRIFEIVRLGELLPIED